MGTMTVDRVERVLRVQFPDAPQRAVRDALKRWGFRFDGSRWSRRLDGVTLVNLAAELERAGARLSYVERTREGERRLEYRLVGTSRQLVPAEPVEAETEARPTAAPVAEPAVETAAAEPRVIRARRCWECGRLVAVDRRDQAELDRRLAAAVEAALARLRERGEPPYLAAAPVPPGVQVSSQFYCGC